MDFWVSKQHVKLNQQRQIMNFEKVEKINT